MFDTPGQFLTGGLALPAGQPPMHLPEHRRGHVVLDLLRGNGRARAGDGHSLVRIELRCAAEGRATGWWPGDRVGASGGDDGRPTVDGATEN